MNVYVASDAGYDGEIIYGVFSTLEAAQEACGPSTAEWKSDSAVATNGERSWYRLETVERVRVDDPEHELGWRLTTLQTAEAGHVQMFELDQVFAGPHSYDTDRVDRGRPPTEQDQAEWQAYIARERAAGRMWSTGIVDIHTTSGTTECGTVLK